MKFTNRLVRFTVSLNYDLTNITAFEYQTEFVIFLRITEKEQFLLVYGTLNNLDFLQ